MKALVIIAALIALQGCAIQPKPNMQLNIICNKSLVDHEGFHEENLSHNRCNAREQIIRFTLFLKP